MFALRFDLIICNILIDRYCVMKMAATEKKSDTLQTDKDISPVPTTFAKSLQQAVGNTSTPFATRVSSNTEDKLRQDSGFSEASSLWLSQSQDTKHNCTDDKDDFSLPPPPLLPSSQCVESPSDHHNEQNSEIENGLHKLQEYYDQLKQDLPLEKLIGRHIGVEYMDIICELNKLHVPALSTIFSLLDDSDLLR